ncbi:MAG TPA: cellulase family glycosylhydrolase [Flavisolibacter sp.]|nr:cellulase family glycosylhydrolase [Flavisolibacter sp.]
MTRLFLFSLFSFCLSFANAQKKQANLVYVDNKGVLRYTATKKEAAFFGVNYTVPFAYGYRSHKALGVDMEKAIDADVHHMARLGLDAFRVHVWDVDITDSLGNLLQNEHLRLFDYLIKKLKEHNIKILITPIAFWGNGYPEPDVKTNGFSYVYGKGGSVVKEEAFKAQENYLKQFFTHINPYTKLSYKDDPDVIAMEINNEPHHSGPKERTTEYVNRMEAAVRSTGWTKPVFYNISESPSYADAVVKANVDGHSFQWYPTGLVAGREVKGNFLPNVAQYRIPFGDTIPAFKNRALMVYEFDAGDVMQPIMYPAMARSYRTAGFQWATQFAYDPLYTAYGNTEYQTHYLNLAYTPAKAISLLIASKIFHRLPRGKSYGPYPVDTLFDVFRISYKEQLSEMNSEEEFYYTGSTTTQPKDISKLKHIAGVGSSPVVQYEGTGAYFLDKMNDGSWMLEVMPDAIVLDDPFKKASPKKQVVQLISKPQKMKFNLLDLGKKYNVVKLNDGQPFAVGQGDKAQEGFSLQPGKFLIIEREKQFSEKGYSQSFSADFFAPKHSLAELMIVHEPLTEVSSGQSITIHSTIAGIDTADKIAVEIRHSSNKWKTVPMQHVSGYEYKAEVPADMVTPGAINYRIMVRNAAGDTYTFPGGFKGNPYAWDEWRNESYQTFVASAQSPIEIYHATRDRDKITLYNTDWRANRVEYIAADDPGRLALKTAMTAPSAGQLMGWQAYFRDKLEGRSSELSSFSKIAIKARSAEAVTAHLSLIDADANAYGTMVNLSTEWKTIELPLSSLQKDSMLLLPRPYPGFLPLWFTSSSKKTLQMEDVEKLEIRFAATQGATPASMEVQWIRLKK